MIIIKHGVGMGKVENNSFTVTCNFCERQLENITDLKCHLKGHSFKRANFRCKYFDFFARQPISMQVHLGKNILIDFVGGQPISMEVHLGK